MRRLRALLLLLFLPASSVAAPPRLLVVISVDQMRADYLERFATQFHAGFARLLKEGAVYTEARAGHVPTQTGPGHAAILTGRYPSQHGIVANAWYDRERGGPVYCAWDPVFGKGPGNLLTYTLGDALKAKDPESKVVSLSGKDRAAILLGGKRSDMTLWYDSKAAGFITSTYYGQAPFWLAAFNRDHPVSDPEGIAATPAFDRLLLALAERTLSSAGLGADEHPDLLALSFSATDYIGHRHGPDSPEIRDQLLSLDVLLGELFERLDAIVGKGRWALALTADHGVLPVPESPAGKALGARRIPAATFEEKLEASLEKAFPLPSQTPPARWLVHVTSPHVYLNRALAATLGLSPEAFLAGAAKAMGTVDEVAAVFDPRALSFDVDSSSYSAVFARSIYPPRSGDLMVLLKTGVLLDEGGGENTSHGLPYDYDARIPLIFWGPGIAAGRRGAPALQTDLAPTEGRLLGVDYPPAPGSRILEDALPKE